MFSHAECALQSLTAALAAADAAPTDTLRRTLTLTRTLRAKLEMLETTTASLIADRERHGDGGAAMLNQVAGRTRRDAARNARTAADLERLPAAQTAVAQSQISLENAALLTEAARKTSAAAVQSDPALMEMAKTLPADELAQHTQRWVIARQSRDELAEQHRRNRRERHVRVWNGANGTVQMRGAFDAETGARVTARLRAEAERLRRSDRRLARDNAHTAGGRMRSAPHHPLQPRRQDPARQPRASLLVMPRPRPRPQLAGSHPRRPLPAARPRPAVTAQPRTLTQTQARRTRQRRRAGRICPRP